MIIRKNSSIAVYTMSVDSGELSVEVISICINIAEQQKMLALMSSHDDV